MDKLTVPWIYADIMVSQEIDSDQRISYISYSKNKWQGFIKSNFNLQ